MELHEEIVRRDIALDVDRDTAWEALADPRRLEAWLAESVDLEISEGAEGTITDHDGTVRDAVVDEVVPGRRLALRWAAPEQEPTIVELTLDDTEDGRAHLVVVEIPVAFARALSNRMVHAGTAFQGPALVAA
jgi:uncharacterized protein YndB with AHSA1/START domain